MGAQQHSTGGGNDAVARRAIEGIQPGLEGVNLRGKHRGHPSDAKRAIEIDPQFAMAHAMLSKYYFDIGELALSRESARQAPELRKRASDRESFSSLLSMMMVVTGDLEKAE